MLAAVVPMALGPDPADQDGALIVALCNGGSIAIPLGDGDDQGQDHCDTKACHSGACRKDLGNRHSRTKT